MYRRDLLKVAIATSLLAAVPQGARAAAPCGVSGKRVRWISPYATAGEVVSRALAPYLEKHLGAEVLVEVAAGAAGIRGSTMIHEARPDGLTLGLVYGALDLFRNELAGSRVPHPARDYTILGRIHGNRHAWAVGGDSRFGTIEDMIDYGREQPLLAATNSPGGSDFATVTITSKLLGVSAQWLTGFRGFDFAVAVARGEADLLCINAAALVPMMEAGDLRPVLQIGRERVSSSALFDHVPLLGGPDGVAAQRARASGRDPVEAEQAVDDLAAVIGAGRLAVGPPGIPEDLATCLATGVYAALQDPGFHARAETIGLILDVADAATAAADMLRATQRVQRFMPELREALRATGHSGGT